jgi:pimeloyl-ACP methyl ester carboxylesterase
LARSVKAALRRLAAGVLSTMLLATSGCAWIDTRQRELIYRPTPTLATPVADLQPGDSHYLVSLPDNNGADHLAFWWLPNSQPDAPALLYLHGTFRNLYGNQRKIESLRSAGFSVLAVDYRGWGESSARIPSEQSILQDANVAWQEFTKRQPDPVRRVIYGHSMGSGAAVNLASGLNSPGDYGGLVLESAFTSFDDVARESGGLARVLSWFTRERFDSAAKIGRVQAPLLMLHGKRDDTIPIRLGARLYAAANSPKRWVTIEGAAHSDLDLVDPALYQSSLRDFVATYLPHQRAER